MFLAEYLLLVLLVLVSYATYRGKERYFYNSMDSYNKIMVGQLCWALLLLLRVLGESGLLDHAPVLARAEYQNLAEAFLLVTGGLFMALGVIEWVNRLTRIDLQSSQSQRRLDLLSAAVNLTRTQKNAATYLHDLRGLLLHYTRAVSVNFYRTEEYSGNLVPAESHSVPLAFHSPLEHWCHSVLRSQRLALVPQEASEDRKATVILPLLDPNSTRLLAIMNWELDVRIDTETLQLLDLVASVLGGRIIETVAANKPTSEASSVLEQLREDLSTVDRLQDAINLVDEALHKIADFEILRIAVYDARGLNVTQYCLGQGKNLLTERNRSISTQRTRLGELFERPQVTYSDTLDASEQEDDKWLTSCGARYALTIPIVHAGKPIAALTFAGESKCPNKAFGEQIATALSSALLPSVRSDIFSNQLVTYNRQILDLTGSLKKLVTSEDTQAFLLDLADTVVKKLPATYCRFWRYDSDKESLEFVVEAQARDVSRHVTEVKSLPLSRARWHKLAIQAGRMMLINQREERMQMDDQELVQSLVVGMQSALLVPMMIGNEPLGIMAIAELRSWDRRSLSLSDSVFARGIANIAAQALKSAATAERMGRLGEHVEKLERNKILGEVFSDLPKRFATPLTSIMARTQQLIDKSEHSDELTANNLSIIKMQTERMIKEVRTLQDARLENLLTR